MEEDEQKVSHLNFEYWINPTNLRSYEFLIEFEETLEKFQKYLSFNPLYKFKNMVGTSGEDNLKKHCFSKGVFCSDDNNFEYSSVLMEGIRQICIAKLPALGKKLDFWWKYIKGY